MKKGFVEVRPGLPGVELPASHQLRELSRRHEAVRRRMRVGSGVEPGEHELRPAAPGGEHRSFFEAGQAAAAATGPTPAPGRDVGARHGIVNELCDLKIRMLNKVDIRLVQIIELSNCLSIVGDEAAEWEVHFPTLMGIISDISKAAHSDMDEFDAAFSALLRRVGP